MTYQPPFTITAKTLNPIALIGEQLGRLSALDEQAQALTETTDRGSHAQHGNQNGAAQCGYQTEAAQNGN